MLKFITSSRYFVSTLLAAVLLSGCGYRKEKEVALNKATGELEYKIWVYRNMTLLEKFSLPINKATCENIDSISAKADTLIMKIKAAENCR